MENVIDYIKWRGDLPIGPEFPINEIDAMIFARLSYLRYEKIDFVDYETIGSVARRLKRLDDKVFLRAGDKDLVYVVGDSNRFKNIKLTDFVQNNNKEIEKQFGAITIHISKDEMFISYIGTDSTLNGWKEDFNMAFMSDVPCQIDGKNYLERIASKFPNKRIIVGGHSKGGNVAIYSSYTVSKSIQDRIEKVYNYDGPGFNEEFINKYCGLEIANRIETFLPQDSIIGRTLNHKEKITVCLSNEKGLQEHDVYSWEVTTDKIVKVEKNTEVSEDIKNTLNNWLTNTTPEQRKIFVDALFELLYSTEKNTLKDISRNLGFSMTKIFKKYREIEVEDKEMLTEMAKLFATSYWNVVKEKEMDKFDKKKEELTTRYLNKPSY